MSARFLFTPEEKARAVLYEARRGSAIDEGYVLGWRISAYEDTARTQRNTAAFFRGQIAFTAPRSWDLDPAGRLEKRAQGFERLADEAEQVIALLRERQAQLEEPAAAEWVERHARGECLCHPENRIESEVQAA